jgi:CHAD domain-containing protein
MNIFSLSDDERKQIEAVMESASGALKKRAQLMLFYDQGLPTHLAAQQAGFSSSQARYWKHQFNIKGLEIFKIKTTGEQEDEIKRDPEKSALTTIGSLPGILPDDLMAEAGRKILAQHFLVMVNHEAGTIEGTNIEDLHDMRVATRRMRAAVDLFGGFYHSKALKPFLQGLRHTGRTLGKVRDLDVTIEKFDHYIHQLPVDQQAGLTPLLEDWDSRLVQARQKLLLHLNSQSYLEFKNEFALFLQTPGMGIIKQKASAPGQSTVQFLAPTLIYARFANVMAFDSVIPSASFEQLHALRIEFKKLRYTLEFFKDVLGEEAQRIIDAIKDLQDHLGDLNDANVACHTITRFIRNWDKQQIKLPLIDRTNPEAILNYLTFRYAERYQLMVSFPTEWQRFTLAELRQNLAKAISAL